MNEGCPFATPRNRGLSDTGRHLPLAPAIACRSARCEEEWLTGKLANLSAVEVEQAVDDNYKERPAPAVTGLCSADIGGPVEQFKSNRSGIFWCGTLWCGMHSLLALEISPTLGLPKTDWCFSLGMREVSPPTKIPFASSHPHSSHPALHPEAVSTHDRASEDGDSAQDSYKAFKSFEGSPNPQKVAQELRSAVQAFKKNMPIIQAHVASAASAILGGRQREGAMLDLFF